MTTYCEQSDSAIFRTAKIGLLPFLSKSFFPISGIFLSRPHSRPKSPFLHSKTPVFSSFGTLPAFLRRRQDDTDYFPVSRLPTPVSRLLTPDYFLIPNMPQNTTQAPFLR